MSQFQEENEGRLIKAAMSDDALPAPDAKERALRLLLAAQPASKEAEFPTGILTALVGVFVSVIGLVLLQATGIWVWALSSIPLTVAVWLVGLNIAAVPVAGFVIVIRRQTCQHV